MKTLVVGAGVIGTTYGYALSRAGIDVTHLVRPGKGDKFQAGVTLNLRDGRKGHQRDSVARYALQCVETIAPSDGYEFILVSVYLNQIEDILDALVPRSGSAIFLIFGANWNGAEPIERMLSRERYLIGLPYGGGTRENGEYRVYLGNKIFLGEADGTQTEKLQRVKALLAGADIQSDIPGNILHALWAAHASAVGLGVGLAQSGNVDAFLKDKQLMAQGYHTTKEIFELCRLRGADPYQLPEQTVLFRVPRWLSAVALRAFCAYDPGIKRVFAHLAQSKDAQVIGSAMLKTAEDLAFDMPRLRAALAAYRQSQQATPIAEAKP